MLLGGFFLVSVCLIVKLVISYTAFPLEEIGAGQRVQEAFKMKESW